MGAVGYIINNRDKYKPVISTSPLSILDQFDKSFHYHRSLVQYEETPLIGLPSLATHIGVGTLLVKDEGQRFGTSAIKILGATHALNEIKNKEHLIVGVCSATDGNHGRALAWTARKNGLIATIFVPGNTARSRIDSMTSQGAEVIVSSGNYDQAVSEAKAFALKNNYILVQDTAWEGYETIPATITAGYYTQMVELSEQTTSFQKPVIDVVFIQAGVGSWPSAVVHYIRKKLGNENIKIVCVEPFNSDAIYESIKSCSLATTGKSQKTIMAGLNCGTPSTLAFEILKKGCDAFLIIDDQYAIDAIKYLNAPLPGDPYIAAGESGAAGLAGLLAIVNNKSLLELKKHLKIDHSSNILVFNTENVTDPEILELLEKEIGD